MLVSQYAGVDRQICWLVQQLGQVGRYVFSQTVGVSRQGQVGRYVGRSNS